MIERFFNRSLMMYMAGTRINVIIVANEIPKIIVHDNGHHNVTLSQPK